MGRTGTAAILVAIIWAIFAFALAWPGGLSITKHTGDALHMIDIVERMARGGRPHLDFITPIGGLAFAPIAALVALGMPVGQAFLWAQIGLGALLGAVAFLVAGRRAVPLFALAFAALVLVLVMALLHGEADVAVSVSMHYNRWAWALGFIAVLMAALPGAGPARLEGPLLGAIMAALALIKATYFAALVPVVIVGLLLTGQRRTFLEAVVTGLVLLAALTALLGPGYWLAYLGDLLAVAGSDLRAQPGVDLLAILTAPAYLAGSGVALAMVVVLRRGQLEVEGLLVLLFVGAGVYITYQNFGNDPQWLALLALLLLIWESEAPEGGPRPVLTLGAAALAAMVAPSFINMAVSPFRHAAINQADYMPALVGADWHQDFYVSRIKANRLRADIPLAGTQGFDAPPPQAPVLFRGEVLADCRTEPMPGYFASITADLAAQGLAQGAGVFVMDILNPLWLYGDHPPLAGGTPWYYSGLPGIEDAQFVLLPACPVIGRVRDQIARELAEAPLTEVARRPLYTLYAR